MSDRLLLESGTGGYLLEDGSGVLLLENPFRIDVNGVDLLSGMHVTGEPTVTNTAYRQCGTMSFRAEGATGSFSIVAENPVSFRNVALAATYYAGLVKTVTPVPSTPGWRVVDVECQDYTVLPGMDVIDSEPTLTGLTDKQIITAAFAAHGTKGVIIGTECQVLATTVTSTATYLGNTLAEFMDALCSLTGASWYVDYSKHLHYFLTESELAPFAVSVNSADNVTTFFCDGLSLPEDSIDLKNAVLYIPGEGGDAVPTWYTDPASIAATAAACGDNGRREAFQRDDRITVQATLNSYGAAFIAANSKKYPGSFTCYQPGLRGGMSINITSADDGLAAAPFAIVSVTTRLIQAGATMADSYVSFDVAFGDRPATLGGTMAKIANKAVPVQAQVDAGLANQVALDFANRLVGIPIVNSLPTMPDAAFPSGYRLVLTTDRMLYISNGTSWVVDSDGSHLYAGSFEAAAIAATAIVANVVNVGGTVTISSSGITLKDAAGNTVLTSAGFAGSWSDFIASGIYNSMFAVATAGVLPMGTSRDDAAGHTSKLPFWTVWRSSGAATATVVADAAWPGGHYVECKFATVGTVSTDNVCLTTDAFPVSPGEQLTLEIIEAALGIPGVGSAGVQVNRTIRYYTAANAYISAVTSAYVYGNTVSIWTSDSDTSVVPLNARYARVEVIAWEISAHNATTYYRLASVTCPLQLSNGNYLGTLHVGGNATLDSYLNVGGVTVTGGLVTGGNTQLAGATSVVGFYGAGGATRQTVTGSRGGNAALASLLTALASNGLIVDSSTA